MPLPDRKEALPGPDHIHAHPADGEESLQHQLEVNWTKEEESRAKRK
jgi:hypothetical protein